MRKVGISISEVRERIASLKGKPVDMRVDCGRKRIVFKSGVIENVYPAVFTVKLSGEDSDMVSYSYSDIMCGDVLVRRAQTL